MRFIKKKFAIIALSCLAIVLCLFCGIGVLTVHGETEFSFDNEAFSYEKSYSLNTVLTIETGKFSNGETSYDAKGKIIYPDGNAFNSSTAVLDQLGVYKVEYSSEIDNKTISETFVFEVENPLVYVQGTGSVEYKSIDLTTYPTIESYPYGTIDFDAIRSKPLEGIVATIGSKSVLKYNKVINLTDKKSTDTIIKLIHLPSIIGSLDCSRIYVTLTDIYDETNQVTFWINDVDEPYDYAYRNVYVKATYGDNIYVGASGKNISRGGIYGTMSDFSMHALPICSAHLADSGIALSFNDSENRLYANGLLVADLDDSNFFSTPWTGWTTGEVKLSVRVEGLLGRTATIVVDELMGLTDLSDLSCNDTEAPEILVDYNGYTEDTVPNGRVGFHYPIFKARAFDKEFGYVNCTALVYRNYYSKDRVSVTVKDSVFNPTAADDYFIEYSAKDVYGNKGVKVVKVNVLGADSPILSCAFAETQKTAVLGTKTIISDPIINNANGNYKTSFTLMKGDTVIATKDAAFSYIFTAPGSYKLICEVVDYIGQKTTCEQSITTVMEEEHSILTNYEEVLPEYFIAGFAYTMPSFEAFDFVAQSNIAADVSFSVGSFTDGKYTAPFDSDEVTVNISTNKCSVTFKKKIYRIGAETNSFDLKSLFISDNISSEYMRYATGEYAKYNYPSGNSSMFFANKLLAEGFSFDFAMLSSSNFSSMEMVLQDSENIDTAVRVFVLKERDTLYLRFNNGGKIQIGKIGSVNDYSIIFNNSFAKFTCNGTGISVNTDWDGKEFNGFKSEFITLKVNISSSEAGSILVKNVCGQQLSSRMRDVVKPVILMRNQPKNAQRFGAKVKLGQVYVGDVVSPVIPKLYMTIETPDGILVEKVEVSEYELELDDYGWYTITYTAFDAAGNMQSSKVVMNVKDTEAPTVAFFGNYTTNANVGDIVTLANVEVSDNVDGAESLVITVFVKDAEGRDYLVKDGKLSMKKAGRYTILYRVTDSSSNWTLLTYDIIVK